MSRYVLMMILATLALPAFAAPWSRAVSDTAPADRAAREQKMKTDMAQRQAARKPCTDALHAAKTAADMRDARAKCAAINKAAAGR